MAARRTFATSRSSDRRMGRARQRAATCKGGFGPLFLCPQLPHHEPPSHAPRTERATGACTRPDGQRAGPAGRNDQLETAGTLARLHPGPGHRGRVRHAARRPWPRGRALAASLAGGSRRPGPAVPQVCGPGESGGPGRGGGRLAAAPANGRSAGSGMLAAAGPCEAPGGAGAAGAEGVFPRHRRRPAARPLAQRGHHPAGTAGHGAVRHAGAGAGQARSVAGLPGTGAKRVRVTGLAAR